MGIFLTQLNNIMPYKIYGHISTIQGLLIEAKGIESVSTIGSNVTIYDRNNLSSILGEVVGFKDTRTLIMPYGDLNGIGTGCRVIVNSLNQFIYPSHNWLGRIIDGTGEAIDGKGPLAPGDMACKLKSAPPPVHTRQKIKDKIDLGVRAINTFTTVCNGQRLGIFSGSGVGKSILLTMLARFAYTDINVIGLIGERGREVKEFIDQLGPQELAKTVIVVATGDEPALKRRQATYLTLTIAEYFRRKGQNVLCLIDSITRFAMAQREIGLNTGEPPTTKGYTPTVFSELPRLLERAGPGDQGEGSITGLFTVLVEGDDHNEPISDAVRGILDGHIVLERKIAERGRYPAINILRSISRTMPDCNTPSENAIIKKAYQLMAIYDDIAELVRIGAYRHGTDPAIDEAIKYNELLENFLRQDPHEKAPLETCYKELANILGMTQ